MYIVAYFERVFADEAANGNDILETGLCQYDIDDDSIDNEVSLDRHQLTDNSSINVVDGVEPIETSGSDWETDEGDQETIYKLYPISLNTIKYQPSNATFLVDTVERWVRDTLNS